MADTSSRRIVLALGAVVVLLTIAGAVSFVLYARRHTPNPLLVAVAPFDVFVAGLDDWRVGLARSLTDRLALSPPLSAVPQAVVAQTWRGAPRPEIAAVELARRVGAGVAVYGRVDSLGPDSVRLSVLAVDALTTRVRFGVLLNHPSRDPDALATALAEHIRHHLTPPAPAARPAADPPSSVP